MLQDLLKRNASGRLIFGFTLEKDHNMSEIVSKVTKIISEQLGKDESEINLESHFIDDLDADSLDTAELVMALEEEFGIDIPDDASEKITTVQSAGQFHPIYVIDPLSPSPITFS